MATKSVPLCTRYLSFLPFFPSPLPIYRLPRPRGLTEEQTV